MSTTVGYWHGIDVRSLSLDYLERLRERERLPDWLAEAVGREWERRTVMDGALS